MAPLPHNNTAIFYVDYETMTVEHTAEIRVNGAVSPASVGTAWIDFVSPLDAALAETTIIRVRYQVSGSNISLPVTTGIEGLTYGSGEGTPDQIPDFLNFVGRSTGGRRVRVAVFGYKNPFSEFRITGAESSSITDAVAVLNGTANTFCAIDGNDATWYPYANVGVNAYWQRQVRAGT